MGLSSFWTAIKRQRFSESSDSRKHVDRVYDHHHTVAPVQAPGDEPPHHFDAIYDTHHHILPAQNSGPKRHPSSPPRIHSPTNTKQHKKPSLWKSASLSIKPSQQSDALKHENSMKRRSFWRSEPKTAPREIKPTSRAPAVQQPSPIQRPEPVARPAEDSRNAKRNSLWRTTTNTTTTTNADLLPTSDAGITDVKEKRSSRRLSLRRTVSSQSSKRNSLRFSFLANGAGDSDDDDIPAVPAIPADIERRKSTTKDMGRHLSMNYGGPVQPGTAITSDDVNTSSQPKLRNSLKRQSLSKLMTGRKSFSDLPAEDKAGNKRKHRSWFSVHGSESSPETVVPPMPALPTASGATVNPSQAAFAAFLHNVHNAAPKGAHTTDYERFLRASRAFDDSVPTPPHHSQRNSFSEVHAPRPRPVSTAAPIALPQVKERSPRRASRCRPRKADNESTSTASPTSPSLLSNEQQREWTKLRQLMDDTSSQPSGSDNGEDAHDEDDGVMGMLRQLSRDEDKEYQNAVRNEKRRQDRVRYLGVGNFENKDALAALECGMAR